MRNVTFIVGLPGSGKTTLGMRIAKETGAILLDDYSVLPDADIVAGERMVITDPNACLSTPERIKDILEQRFGAIKLTFIAFANDPEQCIANIAGRDDRKISSALIRTISSRYIPELFSPDVREVFRP